MLIGYTISRVPLSVNTVIPPYGPKNQKSRAMVGTSRPLLHTAVLGTVWYAHGTVVYGTCQGDSASFFMMSLFSPRSGVRSRKSELETKRDLGTCALGSSNQLQYWPFGLRITGQLKTEWRFSAVFYYERLWSYIKQSFFRVDNGYFWALVLNNSANSQNNGKGVQHCVLWVYTSHTLRAFGVILDFR